MEITEAKNYKEEVIALLSAEKLPVEDLPSALENFLVARENNEVVGAIGLEIYEDNGLLRSLIVRGDHRNAGTAGILLAELEGLAIAKGLNDIYLLTETASDYFSRKNFIVITRADVPATLQQSSEFSYVCPQSAVVMKKTLSKQ